MELASLLRQIVSCLPVETGAHQLHVADAVSGNVQDADQQRRFEGMGLVLVTDAVVGCEMLGVEFFADGRELPSYASSVLARRNRGIMAFPSAGCY
jgi:hypothetical protein